MNHRTCSIKLLIIVASMMTNDLVLVGDTMNKAQPVINEP